LFRGASSPSEGDIVLSLLLEIGVRNEVSGDFFLGDVDHPDATTRGRVSVGSVSNGLFNESHGLFLGEVFSVVSVNETLNISTARATDGNVFLLSEADHVYFEDLVPGVRVPARADHVSLETRVTVNNVL
jgi:uncharacterized protein YneR